MAQFRENQSDRGLLRFLFALIALQLLSGCYFFDFFKKKSRDSSSDSDTTVLGQSIGAKAGGQDDAGLASLYAVTTDVPPAPIRPDPDVMVRRLLRQYRDEGATIARQIGKVEDYRLLLGGATRDFTTAPQESYDATSVLANLKVAEDVCAGLVAPNGNDHPGWATILPAAPTDADTNLRFLAQRLTGMPSSRIPTATIDGLKVILNHASGGASYTLQHYVPVCVTAALDASAMFF